MFFLPEGFSGTNCDVDINECEDPAVCGDMGKCYNNQGSYTCQCLAGYFGPACQVSLSLSLKIRYLCLLPGQLHTHAELHINGCLIALGQVTVESRQVVFPCSSPIGNVEIHSDTNMLKCRYLMKTWQI